MMLSEMLRVISEDNNERVCRAQYQRIVGKLYEAAENGEKSFSTWECIREPVVKALKAHGLKVKKMWMYEEYAYIFTISW